MATKNKINVYMYLLELSNKYIEESIKSCDDSRSSSKPDHHERHYKIDYHMFTFTQLIYTIKERLKNEYPSDKKKIEDFFNNSTNLTAAVKEIANFLKHEETEFIDTSNIIIQIDKKNNSSKVLEVRTDRRIKSSDVRIRNKDLSKLFKDVYSELANFLKSKKYDY